ncbi:uncharacterized protein [Henckelia pumila]|uniref:uncharacterized protein n=1 Tax=Henckelia pumila TaxID=405737 RepID=UPI003C6E16C0
MAYAALVSLELSLNQIMLYPDQHSVHHDLRTQIQSFLPKLEYLQEFLESSSRKTDEETCSLITRIRDAAYEAQDTVDLYCYEKEMAIIGRVVDPDYMDLQNIIQEIDAIKSDIREHIGSTTEEVTNIEYRSFFPDDLQLLKSFRAAGSSKRASKNMVVGFEDHITRIMDELMGQRSALSVVPILGIGGIGKTTLASEIYNSPSIMLQFDFRAWVVISRSYTKRNMLLHILDSMEMLSDEMHGEDENKLTGHLYQALKGKRYLITMDDVWDISVWDEMKMVLFPNDDNGSRILLTTRLADVADYVSSWSYCHHLVCLSEEQSWSLLCSKVFGDEKYCPLELEQIGRKISQRCQGLPLSLVVMGGLLSRIDETEEAWLDVVHNHNVISTSDDDLESSSLRILKLSYDYLPQWLKPCFLYMAHFKEDEEISVSRLIKLWVAEGFLKQDENQNPEAVAEKCLKELVDRNMIIISKQKFEGKIKTCRIHDLLLDLCIREADKEKFLCVMTPTSEKTPHNHLRLSIHSRTPDLIFPDPRSSFSLVRSLLYTGISTDHLSSSVFLKFKLLRVLDALKVAFPNFPDELLDLVNLRYISFTCPRHIPPSISNLGNLQTLIIHKQNWEVEIWNMTHLRHVEFENASLPCPAIGGSTQVLTNLRTLSGIRNLRFTEEVVARIKYIERLEICYDDKKGWSFCELRNLVNLHQLRALKIYFHSLSKIKKREFRLPPSLKELSLRGFDFGRWLDSSTFGYLPPDLEILKLKSCAMAELKSGERFRGLKLLLLQNLNLRRWTFYGANLFPCLERLIVRDCDDLIEIPPPIGKISTLNMIECDKGALASADRIQEMQHARGNHHFQLILHNAKTRRRRSFIIYHIKESIERIRTIVKRNEVFRGKKRKEAKRSSEDLGSAITSIDETKQRKIPRLAPLVIDSGGIHKSCMVGFHEGFSQIKNWLTESKTNDQLQVMTIVGMAGTGKTTLARNLFDPADLDHKFRIYVWISVSRTSNVQKVMILDSMRLQEDELDHKSIEQLTDILNKRLKGEKYLIVLDDVWDIQLWHDIKRSFPDDNTRSRIIVTTRLREMDLGVGSSEVHHMVPLPPEMSQTLFCTKVFGNEKCPQDLEHAAKHILGKCRGLPLAIVVIGGLLSKVSRSKVDWQLILENMNSTITSKEHLKGIMSFGYNYLPLYLRACFRSMIHSQEDHELSVPRLVRLWIDEGLVDETCAKSPEEVAGEFLKDLMDRSFIIVCKQSKEAGEVETCGIPSIWQEYFVANDPDILPVLLSKSEQSTTNEEGMEDPPRSYNEGVSIEEGQKGDHDEENKISMDMLFNNIYTKDCIRYCSLFPTTFEFTKDVLASLWIAQGWKIAGNDAFIEEACIRCFDILLNVKYIVPTGYDPYGDQIKYKVGEEMHAFLQDHLIRPQFSKQLDGHYIEDSKPEHLSLSFMEIGQIDFEITKKLSRLQTLMIHGCYGFEHLPFDLFLELKSLRTLSLSHTDVVELPSSIECSQELRYLDMSETPIRWLPESMCNLSNLQTLKLDNCLGLVRLPKRMKQLINLRHLILDVARQLQSMPECIGYLSELRTLRAFLVGVDDGCCIDELKHMNKLSGSLRILKLENIKTPEQAADASLSCKQDLKKIELQWSDLQDKINPIEEEILTCLEPPLGIQELKILYYSGGNLPNWISKPSFSEMVSITLHKCRYCSNLPSLGLLPSLKHLSIIGMNEVLEINSLFCGEQGNDQNQPSFPALQNLSFCSMSKLEKWTEMRTGDFPRLMNLTIESCPKINCLPSLTHLNSLMHMVISYCPKLSCLSDGILPSTLESLMIKDCPKLKERCSVDGGEDWPKIAHVPVFYIDDMKIHTK